MNWKRLKIVLLFCCVLFKITNAQTFSMAGDTVPDNLAGRVFSLQVSGLPNSLNSSFGLLNVCMDITHPRASDLYIFLLDPINNPVEISTGNGGNTANYTNVCFNQNSLNLLGNNSTVMAGDFLPEHSIGVFNNGQNPNGIWKLVVRDLTAGGAGFLNNWSLTFGANPPLPLDSMYSPCNVVQPDSCLCEIDTQSICLLLPDIIIGKEFLKGGNYLEDTGKCSVATASGNIGIGPLEIIGSGEWYCGDSLVAGSGLCPDGTYSKQMVRQRVYTKSPIGYFVFLDSAVGTMGFHAALGHQHLHIDDWSENSIRIRGKNPNPATWPVISKGKKISFSIYDMMRCEHLFKACTYDNTVYEYSNLKNAGLGLGYEFGSQIVQGLSVGYSDIYGRLLDGQEIYLDSTVCNGDYVLVAQFDPKNIFLESNKENNISIVPITLTKQKANCCNTIFSIDTIDFSSRNFSFEDKSMAMPNQWHWDFGDGDTSDLQFPNHQYQSGGDKWIKLSTTTAQGCSGSYQFLLQLPFGVGVAPISKSISYAIAPNPSKGLVRLTFDKEIPENMQWRVTDVLGREIVAPQKIENLVNNIHISTKGIYFFTIIADDFIKTEKIIIE